MAGIVVVGAGQAGASLVQKLRKDGYGGPVTLVGREPFPPYQRPPLSKAYLKGEMERVRLFLRPEAWYKENEVALLTGTSADAIDVAGRTVRVNGEPLPYDELVLTTGATPRALPEEAGGRLPGVFEIRGLGDIDRLAPALKAPRRLAVIGGGYIGLEAAAVAAELGLEVTLFEVAQRILGRVASEETAAYYRDLHRRHGVTIREGAAFARLVGDGRLRGVLLADGTEVPADLAIVGIGIVPETRLATRAGIDTENGIAVDSLGRTSAPHVWAAGDCASLPWRGRRIRLESVQNAIEQAETVAANIMGAEAPYDPHPWFWSDQYDVKLQIAGLNHGYDRVVVRPGQSHWYYAGDTLLAVDAMGDARAYMVGKRLIEAGRSPDPAAIADPATDLKALLR
jgi:3-phenylpropionate/trans-cinnamate dioxygenase ferredoxin reductase subunit